MIQNCSVKQVVVDLELYIWKCDVSNYNIFKNTTSLFQKYFWSSRSNSQLPLATPL